MSQFQTFFKHYLQFFIYLVLIFVIIGVLTHSDFMLGLVIGTIASAISTFVWYHYLARAIQSDALYITTGMGIRFLIAAMACLFWVRYPETFSLLGIALGLMFTYVMIIIHGVKSLKK